MQRGQKLEEELKLREQELETTLSKQKEVNCQSTRGFYVGTVWKFHRWVSETCLCLKLETRIRQLTCEQANFRKQNQQLRSINMQLQEQVENSRQQLQTALSQLSLLQLNAAQEQMTRQRWVDVVPEEW